ncbi:MAG TPA: hypothetical protein VH852_01840 [Hyphomicrobium sp.]|jgi:hypothetical protein
MAQLEGQGVDERNVGGYAVTYNRDEIQFPVYVIAVLAAILLAAAWVTGQTLWLALGLVAAGVAYYNFPLLESGRPTLGANQYGIFIQGFGLIGWRAIDRIDVVEIAERATTLHELQIGLNMVLSRALVVDWRKQPFWRSLMRLPWSMGSSNVVRVNLEPFSEPPEEIGRTLTRLWRYYRS